MKKKLSILILFLLFVVSYGKQFTDQFTQEFGGMGTFAIRNDKYENDTTKYTTISGNLNPFYHFYILKCIYFGPAVSYSYEEMRMISVYKTRIQNLSLGIDAGLAIANKTILIPYLQFNYSADLYFYTGTSSNQPIDQKSEIDDVTNQFAIDLGIKIVISKYISINLSTGYTYYNTHGFSDQFNGSFQDSHEILKSISNNFRIINVGLSGLIF